MKFIRRAYRNRYKTRLASSLILGVPVLATPVIVTIAMAQARPEHPGSWLVVVGYWAAGILGYALYPLTREMYFQATRPDIPGRKVTVFLGPAILFLFWAKLVVYAILIWFALPIGLIALLILGINGRNAPPAPPARRGHSAPAASWSDYYLHVAGGRGTQARP